MASTKLVHVPCKGTAPAMQDLLGGHAQVMKEKQAALGIEVVASTPAELDQTEGDWRYGRR